MQFDSYTLFVVCFSLTVAAAAMIKGLVPRASYSECLIMWTQRGNIGSTPCLGGSKGTDFVTPLTFPVEDRIIWGTEVQRFQKIHMFILWDVWIRIPDKLLQFSAHFCSHATVWEQNLLLDWCILKTFKKHHQTLRQTSVNSGTMSQSMQLKLKNRNCLPS